MRSVLPSPHFMVWPVLMALCLALATNSRATELHTDLHPMDGPDVELRVQRTQTGFRVALRANLVFLDETLGSLREVAGEIAPEEHGVMEQAAMEWLRQVRLLTHGDQALELKKIEAQWIPADPERIPYFPREGSRALTYLDIRLEGRAPTDLEAVTVGWRDFPINPVLGTGMEKDSADTPTIEVKAVLMAGPEERLVTLGRNSPEYTWRLPQGRGADHLLPLPVVPEFEPRIPKRLWLLMALGASASALMLLRKTPMRMVLALGAIGVMFVTGQRSMAAPTTDWNDAVAERVFRTLHGNLYRAFDFHEPEAVYDALEQSVHGSLLEQLYSEIHTSLIMEEEEGALCRVESVDIKKLDVSSLSMGPPLELTASCTWRVLGVVHHWGHSHQRLLEWQARFQIQATPHGWRFVAAQIERNERLPLEETPRESPEDFTPLEERTF